MTDSGEGADGLAVDGIRKAYGDTVALDGLSMHVPDGTMHGFVGPNGAGKTTAMRIVLGVLGRDAGTVRWRGRPVDAAVRRRFGYMPEERGLYPKMQVEDHLVYLARLHGRGAAAARSAAATLLDRLGIGERRTDRVEALSLGNQQRVQLAAALVHDPELLILDEPFSGLDPVGVDVLADVLLERVRGGVPVVFSSHQLELVERLCSTVTIVRSGRVVAAGPVADLRGAAAAGRRRLRVEVDGAPGWVDTLPAVTVVEKAGDGVVLELAPDGDSQRVLDAARAAGTVRHFSEVSPTLTDLFREAVAA